ncbi:MAG: aminotransferase class V-fold PLP-dependent enzyme [Candidatus Nanohaloarchaea archaeon]
MKKQDFPELEEVYLDSACMSLRPEQVIEAVQEYYTGYPACPGRGNHRLSEKATGKMEEAREKIAGFIDAGKDNIILTSGTTEGINTVARGFDPERVLLSDIEHNSNLAPWQRSQSQVVTIAGDSLLDRLENEVQPGDLISLVHVSNLDGREHPVSEAANIARENDAYLMVDAAQSIPHRPFSVEEVRADFVAFSGHKMLGPSGTGALYVSDRVQDQLEPLKTGGGAVTDSTYSSHESKNFPHGHEPGLPNVAGVIGLGAAVDYLEDIGMETVEEHERDLTNILYNGLDSIEAVENVGSRAPGVVSFRIGDLEANQVALMLDQRDIAVRAGMHCVHSWFNSYDERPTVRASLHLYNDRQDINRFLNALREISKLA